MPRGLLGKIRTFVRRGAVHMDVVEQKLAALEQNVADQSTAAGRQLDFVWRQLQLDIASWRLQELAMPRYEDPRHLNRFEHKVYSQDGGDGILAEIFRRVGEGTRYFVEFGISNGLECNSTYLLTQRWSGLWIEGSAAHVAGVREAFAEPVADSRLTVLESFVTAENIEDLLRDGGVPEEPSLLSIDIDGNDYWVWKAIASYRPRVVEIEYNAMFPPDAKWVMEYNPEHVWGADSYAGASLRSMTDLAEAKGYRLVACSLAGVNAFYVRSDLIRPGAFTEPSSPAELYQPPRYHLVYEAAGNTRAYGRSVAE